MIEDDDELEIDIELIDEHAEDCADYFATVLSDTFEGIDLITFSPNEWRKGWRILVRPHFTYTVKDVEEQARKLRDRIWWEKSILVPYAIERPED